MKTIDFHTALRRLLNAEDVLILTHASPDGDTLGSGYALFRGLLLLGKRVKLLNNEPIPEKFQYLSRGLENGSFEEQYIISVDVADKTLLGAVLEESYGDRIDLSLDHHGANRLFAKETYVESDSASAGEIVYLMLLSMGLDFSKEMADCLYTAVSTDTGCFRYSNVTARTHRIAADLIERGADHTRIDVQMFETKDMSFLRLQQKCLEALELYFDGRVSVLSITRALLDETGCRDENLDDIVALSRQIAGVRIGVTFKEKKDGTLKVSVRTHEGVDAAQICARFGGGGHKRAAGCQFTCSKNEALTQMLPVLEEALQISHCPLFH